MRTISRNRTALMGFAALWIYYFHVVPVGYLEGTALEQTEWFLHRIGFCGVDMFFLLSAYGLYHRFQKEPVCNVRDFFRYFGRRLLRIYPVIVPVALMMALIDNTPLRSLIPRLTFYDAFFVNIYSFLWFVPCVLVFYLAAPFCVRLSKRGYVIAIAVSVLAGFLLRNVLRWDLYALVNRIPVFLTGFQIAERETNAETPDKRNNGVYRILLLLCVLTAGNILSYLVNRDVIPSVIPAMNALCNLLIAPPLTILLSMLFERLRNLAKILQLFGAVSLEFYAWQEWIWSKIEPLRINMARRQVACFLLVTILAYGLHAMTGRMRNRD